MALREEQQAMPRSSRGLDMFLAVAMGDLGLGTEDEDLGGREVSKSPRKAGP